MEESEIENVDNFGNIVHIQYKGENFRINLSDNSIINENTFDKWDGKSVSTGLIGMGTVDEPYLIKTASDLKYLSQSVCNEANIKGLENDGITANNCNELAKMANYKLESNISLENYEWTPIGYNPVPNSKSFMGKFDGGEFEITKLKVHNTTTNDCYFGLFATLYKAEIKNVIVTETSITGYSSVGGIAGYSDEATINNCYHEGTIESVSDFSYVGGLIGSSYNSKIENCANLGSIKGKTWIGGLIGTAAGITISNSHNNGLIQGNSKVGGLAGEIQGESTINNSYNTEEIKQAGRNSYYSYFGGLAGSSYNVNINNSYNTGNITVPDITTQVGGLLGIFGSSTGKEYKIYNSFNSGNLGTNPEYIGGIVGAAYVSNGSKLLIDSCSNAGTVTSNKQYVRNIIGQSSNSVTIK